MFPGSVGRAALAPAHRCTVSLARGREDVGHAGMVDEGRRSPARTVAGLGDVLRLHCAPTTGRLRGKTVRSTPSRDSGRARERQRARPAGPAAPLSSLVAASARTTAPLHHPLHRRRSVRPACLRGNGMVTRRRTRAVPPARLRKAQFLDETGNEASASSSCIELRPPGPCRASAKGRQVPLGRAKSPLAARVSPIPTRTSARRASKGSRPAIALRRARGSGSHARAAASG
jgi:hypothetical protein